MKLTFLGTGTSFGIPVVGCGCRACSSDDPRDRRTRHGAVVELPEGRLLVDTPPELRIQLVNCGIPSVDAVWFTHHHADHIHGIDDLRIVSLRSKRPVRAFAAPADAAELGRRFPYVFEPRGEPQPGVSRPEVTLDEVEPARPVELLGATLLPLAVPHGRVTVLGFRVGGLGYVTDAEHLPEPVIEALSGVRVLVLNALWRGDPHPTHMNVEEAVAAARSVGAEKTFLTHMSHRVLHHELEASLPEGIAPAYDGLTVEVPAP